MAGPAAGLVLPRSQKEHEPKIQTVIAAHAEKVEGAKFWVEGRPFFFWLGEEFPGELDELASEFPDVLGWEPVGLVGVCAYCNGSEDHRLLGELMLSLVEEVGGIIDFGGVLLPHGVEAPSHPGHLWRASNEVASGGPPACQYGDAEFLRWFMQTPEFRLVK